MREAPPVGAARVVGIDGRSGAGKTDLADEVHAATGWPVVHAEGVYPGWDGLAKAPALLAEHLLRPLSHGQDAELPTWDWRAGHPGPVRFVPFAPVVVLEGCAATAEPARELLCVTVWLSAPEAVRRRRALDRDGETFAPHWERWARQERSVLRGLEGQADLVLAT
ncbi:AAA family ATPase [Marihabitans asiaticum]